MPIQVDEISLLDLSRDDIAKLPAMLRKKIAAAFGPDDNPSGDWLLVGARHPWLMPVLARAMHTLPRLATERRSQISEQTIEKLIDIFMDGAPRAVIDAALELDNAQLRANYLQDTPTLTGAEVRAYSGLSPKNKSEPASRWKREDRLFSLRHDGAELYPAFQFTDGAPIPAVKKILKVLPNELTPWQIALWFASGNGWLDAGAPQERMNEPDAVVSAAKQLANPAIG